ncbi:MAG: hypothetical protein GY696_38765, partial [Gammaproteobacteria bacterium]|nr:hypothetical protein [Gammaproteobacteria bacterium]
MVPFLKKDRFFGCTFKFFLYLITIMKVFVFLDLYQKRLAEEVEQQESGFAALRKRLACARSVADVSPLASKDGNQAVRPAPRQQPAPTLPAPRFLHNADNQKLTSGDPTANSLFSTDMAVTEVNSRLVFTPAAPALIDISRQVYQELSTDDSSIGKQILPQYIDYYVTALLWMRMVCLKQANSQALTDEEQDLILLIQNTSFVVPEPILLQLRTFGNVQTKIKQHLIPEFPPLPVTVINNIAGFFPQPQPPAAGVDDALHLLFLEFPCLGVMSEAVMQAVSQVPAGAYQSVLTYGPNLLQPTGNLPGFQPLGYRRDEARNFALDIGITQDTFPCHPANTGFNYDFMNKFSTFLAKTKKFKNTEIVFTTLSGEGSLNQTIRQIPAPVTGTPIVRGDIQPASLTMEDTTLFGSSIMFCPQLYKEAAPNNDHSVWSLFQFSAANPIPQAWVDNRNARRNLPPQYAQVVFRSIGVRAQNFRTNVIKTFATTQRKRSKKKKNKNKNKKMSEM